MMDCADCSKCKWSVWDYIEYSGPYGSGNQGFVEDCELGNSEECCQDFEEYLPPLPEGW